MRPSSCAFPDSDDPPPTSGRVAWAYAVAALSAACSVTPESYATDEDAGSTQVVVAIARQESFVGRTRADALAGFLRLPASADRQAALELAGLGVQLPELGHCWQGEQGRSSTALEEVPAFELLEAGRVRVVADGGEPHELAPHAFPSVADFISGVLYASRERSGEGLPAGELYRLETDGGAVGALTLEQAAPRVPSDVTLNGIPLDSVEHLRTDEPLDLIWSGSSHPNDRVYVELTSAGSSRSLLCAFEDAAGAGTLSLAGFTPRGSAQLSLHRLRVTWPSSPGATVDQIELRFDFSVARSVEFE